MKHKYNKNSYDYKVIQRKRDKRWIIIKCGNGAIAEDFQGYGCRDKESVVNFIKHQRPYKDKTLITV